MSGIHAIHVNTSSYYAQDANVLAASHTKTYRLEMKIGELITRLAKAKGYSDNEISRLTGEAVPQPTVSRIMNGESKNPRRSTLEPIAKVFGLTYIQPTPQENQYRKASKSSSPLFPLLFRATSVRICKLPAASRQCSNTLSLRIIRLRIDMTNTLSYYSPIAATNATAL